AQPQHFDQRPDHPPRVRRERPLLVDPLPERRSDLRRRSPREAHLLMTVAALYVAGALVVCAAGAAFADVADYVGKPVASIRAEAEGQAVTDRRILELIETQPGAPLSMQNVRRTVAHLISLGR